MRPTRFSSQQAAAWLDDMTIFVLRRAKTCVFKKCDILNKTGEELSVLSINTRGIASMKQLLIRVRMPKQNEGEKISPSHGRMLLSKNVANIPNIIFHKSEGGGNLQYPSPIRFRGGKNSFGVVVVEDIDTETQLALTNAFIQYACEHDGNITVRNIECDIEKTFEDHVYQTSMILGKSNVKGKGSTHEGRNTSDKSSFNHRIIEDETFRQEQIVWTIANGLCRQAHRYFNTGQLLREERAFLGRFDYGAANKGSIKELIDGIKLMQVSTQSPVYRYLPRYFVKFKMPVRISGDWAVGRMNHKGHGQIIMVRS